MSADMLITLMAAFVGGALKVSVPFLFVSLGETITERSGRVNLGLEGSLVFGAMIGYAASFHSGSAWVGVIAAGIAGAVFGWLHGFLCGLPKVNDTAIGIALMVLGLGLAFLLGKAYVQPSAPRLGDIALGSFSSHVAVQAALKINIMLPVGIACALALHWALKNTTWGLALRTVGDSQQAALALGLPVNRIRTLATMAGGVFAGIAGAFLSLYYPGSWNEALSSGQGIMAVALVIFARWQPLGCVWAALIFGGASSIGPALQSIGIQQGYQLWNAAPYVLTLVLMYASSGDKASSSGQAQRRSLAPAELSLTR